MPIIEVGVDGLVTVARYQHITGDLTTSQDDVREALDDALALLEEDLGRPLASEERTERVYPGSDGRLYPIVTPITAVASGYTADGAIVHGGAPFLGDLLIDAGTAYVDLVYTGGYVERDANPTASNRLPAHIERDVCWAAYRMLHPSALATAVPVGATSVRLGDAGVGYGTKGAPQGSDGTATWSKATLRLKRAGRRV